MAIHTQIEEVKQTKNSQADHLQTHKRHVREKAIKTAKHTDSHTATLQLSMVKYKAELQAKNYTGCTRTYAIVCTAHRRWSSLKRFYHKGA